jgi:hypothetical protein
MFVSKVLLQNNSLVQKARFLPQTDQTVSQCNYGYTLARFVNFEQKSSLFRSMAYCARGLNMDSDESNRIYSVRLHLLRRVSYVSLAVLLIVAGIIGLSDASRHFVQAAANPGGEAVALNSTNPFAKTSDPVKDSIINYFQAEANGAVVQTVSKPFSTSPSAQGAKQAAQLRNQSKARFIEAFQSKSGIKVNIYQSTLGTPLRLQVDSGSIATMLQFVIDHAMNANNGYMSQAQIARMQSLASAGKLDYATVYIILSASPDVCNDQLIPASNVAAIWKDNKTCDTSGTYFPLNLSGGAQVIEQTLSVALFDGQGTYPAALTDRLALTQKGVTTLVHEFAHAFADLSGVRSQRLAAGMAEKDLDTAEHSNFVDPMENMVQSVTNSQVAAAAIDQNGNPVAVTVPHLPFPVQPFTLSK